MSGVSLDFADPDEPVGASERLPLREHGKTHVSTPFPSYAGPTKAMQLLNSGFLTAMPDLLWTRYAPGAIDQQLEGLGLHSPQAAVAGRKKKKVKNRAFTSTFLTCYAKSSQADVLLDRQADLLAYAG